MTARIRHGDGDRRQLAYADLAVRRGPVRPAGRAAGAAGVRLLRQPQPDPAGTYQACGAELTDDQLRALVDCTHPTVADIPAGERSLNSTGSWEDQVVGLSGSRRGVPTTGSEGTGESSIYRYACFRSQRMATAPQIGGR